MNIFLIKKKWLLSQVAVEVEKGQLEGMVVEYQVNLLLLLHIHQVQEAIRP